MTTSRTSIRIGVVGGGAIGSLYAAHLARHPRTEVWVLDVNYAQVTAMNRLGIQVTGKADFTAPVRAVSDPSDLPGCDLGIVATKARHTRAALEPLRDAFADAAVASMQNGIGNEEIIAEFVPRVIRATILPAGVVVQPGVVRYDAPGESWLGPFEPKPARPEEVGLLAELLNESGLPTHALGDARGAQWTKLLFNSATNPLTALTGLTMGEFGELPALRSLAGELVAEGRTVCARLGIEPDGDPEVMMDEARIIAADHRSSMLADVLARRPTEIDVLNGGIVREGARVGVATPLHEAVVALIQGLERSWNREGTTENMT